MPPDDPAAAADAVTRLMSDDALRTRLAEGALALSHHFDWDTIAQQHIEMYSWIV